MLHSLDVDSHRCELVIRQKWQWQLEDAQRSLDDWSWGSIGLIHRNRREECGNEGSTLSSCSGEESLGRVLLHLLPHTGHKLLYSAAMKEKLVQTLQSGEELHSRAGLPVTQRDRGAGQKHGEGSNGRYTLYDTLARHSVAIAYLDRTACQLTAIPSVTTSQHSHICVCQKRARECLWTSGNDMRDEAHLCTSSAEVHTVCCCSVPTRFVDHTRPYGIDVFQSTHDFVSDDVPIVPNDHLWLPQQVRDRRPKLLHTTEPSGRIGPMPDLPCNVGPAKVEHPIQGDACAAMNQESRCQHVWGRLRHEFNALGERDDHRRSLASLAECICQWRPHRQSGRAGHAIHQDVGFHGCLLKVRTELHG
mmetsp:Transcript_8641/g.13710  ORF Transcript_8641/g.13710 Transcript_8641/m.13710 type:complete len:362 (-) Transcript_8641:511-1596(-)